MADTPAPAPLLVAGQPREKRLGVVHHNAGAEAAFRKALGGMIDDMGRSYLHWVPASYRANEPAIAYAMDASSPSSRLAGRLLALGRFWRESFDRVAGDFAAEMAGKAQAHARAGFQAVLKRAGFALKVQHSDAQRDLYNATVHDNIALIKSIPEQFHLQVTNIVNTGVMVGGDAHQITNDIQQQLGVTKRRADLIARDQIAKANATFTRANQIELGITKAQWVHSGAGKHPRPSHMKAGKDKLVYEVAKGAYLLEGKKKIYTWPGHEINCRCLARSIIPGYNDVGDKWEKRSREAVDPYAVQAASKKRVVEARDRLRERASTGGGPIDSGTIPGVGRYHVGEVLRKSR
jgi:hypothetical protein